MPEADLVLSGGGVKGAALLGAAMTFTEQDDPYTFRRIAGTSAGAIVGAYLAAGIDTDSLTDLVVAKDFADFQDEAFLSRSLGGVGSALDVLIHEGLYIGDALHTWVRETLESRGIRTWADLRSDGTAAPVDAPGTDLEDRYKLVVVVSDVSRGRQLRLPWDYERQLGVDPDEQLVADAVRASASIPFFFRPARVAAAPDRSDGQGYVACLDGGLLSGYPIDIFDRVIPAPLPSVTAPPALPTIGVKLSAREEPSGIGWADADNPIELGVQIVRTLYNAHDAMHIDDPYYAERTAFVDTTGFDGTDFHLTREEKEELFARGAAAARKFLASFDAASVATRPRREP